MTCPYCTPTFAVNIFYFVLCSKSNQCSKHTDSSSYGFLLVNIRIPTGGTLLTVNIIELKYILTRRNMVGRGVEIVKFST